MDGFHEITKGSLSNSLIFAFFLRTVVIYQNWFFDSLRMRGKYVYTQVDNWRAFVFHFKNCPTLIQTYHKKLWIIS
jgi:hypothetical protein